VCHLPFNLSVLAPDLDLSPSDLLMWVFSPTLYYAPEEKFL